METLWLGAVAYDPKAVTIWESIREVFRAAKVPFEFALLSSYEALVEALLEDRIEVAWATPTAYLQIQRRAAGRALALGMRDVDVGMRSQLVVRRGSPLESISALRRRRIAFGSRDSAQAAILPLHHGHDGCRRARLLSLEAGFDDQSHGNSDQLARFSSLVESTCREHLRPLGASHGLVHSPSDGPRRATMAGDGM